MTQRKKLIEAPSGQPDGYAKQVDTRSTMMMENQRDACYEMWQQQFPKS